MRVAIVISGALQFALFAAIEMTSSVGARAQGAYLYAIAANDGYGLQECLAGGEECGQVVADAWCEAHGHGKALSFGPASHLSSPTISVSTAADSYLINCGD
jgi:hypothetical protein